jgi:chromatin segregation and condensation protein Rec8/ScpA/Scc1 (kleisin family)
VQTDEGEEVSDALLEALARIVERIAARKPPSAQVARPVYLSLQQVMRDLQDLVRERGTVTFESIFDASDSRERVVLSFLAVLILTKMGVLRIAQEDRFADIVVEYAGTGDA